MNRIQAKLFIALFYIISVTAFSSGPGLIYQSSQIKNSPIIVCRRLTLLCLSDDKNADSLEKDRENNPNAILEVSEGGTETQSQSDKMTKSKSAARGILEGATSLYSIFVIGFGAAMTLGILLNIEGFGYKFTVEEGLRIDTLEEMRMEKQLQQPSRKTSETQPLPGAMIGSFFMKQPFTASLLVTGTVLLFEEIKGSASKGDGEK
jgi:hypothetical protein